MFRLQHFSSTFHTLFCKNTPDFLEVVDLTRMVDLTRIFVDFETGGGRLKWVVDLTRRPLYTGYWSRPGQAGENLSKPFRTLFLTVLSVP